MKTLLLALCSLLGMALLTGCNSGSQMDYSNFRQSNPKSILVLPPLNESPDVNASYSVLSHVTYPLAESGYYVLPVALVNEAFRENGLTQPGEIHTVSREKLYEIFGADAVLYLTVTDYGTSYKIIASDTRVTISAKLLDLRTGDLLWSGSATASSTEGDNNNGILVALIGALINQVADTVRERSHSVGEIAANRLLSAGGPKSILYGPRSPLYGTDSK